MIVKLDAERREMVGILSLDSFLCDGRPPAATPGTEGLRSGNAW